MFFSETYSIEDCTLYKFTTQANSTTTLNYTLPSGAFKLEYDSYVNTRTSGSIPYVDIGRGTNDRILVGQWARAGNNGIILYTGSQTNHALPNLSTLNAWNHYTFTYDGSDYTIDRDGENITVTGVGIHLDKIIHLEGGSGGYLKNLKVKPL